MKIWIYETANHCILFLLTFYTIPRGSCLHELLFLGLIFLTPCSKNQPETGLAGELISSSWRPSRSSCGTWPLQRPHSPALQCPRVLALQHLFKQSKAHLILSLGWSAILLTLPPKGIWQHVSHFLGGSLHRQCPPCFCQDL